MTVLGLDIGGANLKAATSDGRARTVSFALWKKPGQLAERLRDLCREFPVHDRIAVTMTGELCDCFPTKADGVRHILHAVARAAAERPMAVWTTRNGFVNWMSKSDPPDGAAASNWLALAEWVARADWDDTPALLIDTGSTTTDIVWLEGGHARAKGFTDRVRLRTGELVYTGVRRTPVCAVLDMEVAAEFFATMLDVYVVLGLMREDPRDLDTADGRPATIAACHARLARMWCADVDEIGTREIDHLARRAADAQVRQVQRAVDQVLDGRVPATIVLAGSGEILGRTMLAQHPLLSQVRSVSLAERIGPELSEAACAYAVARLATNEWPVKR
jgi:probable H4MPT-linked C1 transfer pathway protein